MRSQSFPRIGSRMSHSYTLERCATFPTNVLSLIIYVTLPWCEAGYQVSPSHAEHYLTLYYPLSWTGQWPLLYAISVETLKSSPCSTIWGCYGLPFTIVPHGNIDRPSRLKIYGTKKKLLTCLSHSKICGQRSLYDAWNHWLFSFTKP
jgi:hypothetical protein